MKTCYSCLKFLVSLFNCLIMIVGVAIAGVFTWVLFDVSIMADVSSSALYVIYFFIGLCSLMAIMGFLGCCGALQESQCLLGMFFFLVLVLFAGQVAVCTWAYMNFQEIEEDFTTAVTDTLSLYNDNEAVRESINLMQRELRCCGSTGPGDWRVHAIKDAIEEKNVLSAIADAIAFKVPTSCCANGTNNCDNTVTVANKIIENTSINNEGCSKQIFDFIKTHQQPLLIAVVVISVVQVFALIFSLVLCITFRKIDAYY